MKITTFNPVITTKDSENVLKLFEDLGFERRHEKDFYGDGSVVIYRMKDANGFYLDIVQNDEAEQDMTELRLNADNFEEAYDVLSARGFKNIMGDEIIEGPTSKGVSMTAPSGFTIALTQHKKKEK